MKLIENSDMDVGCCFSSTKSNSSIEAIKIYLKYSGTF